MATADGQTSPKSSDDAPTPAHDRTWHGIVQQALRCYFAQTGLADDARAYEEGYRRKPERPMAAESYAHVAVEVLAREKWS